jgi:hypothetical protein
MLKNGAEYTKGEEGGGSTTRAPLQDQRLFQLI